MTGYGEGELPDWVPPVRRFAKPFHMPDLVACLPDLIQRSREGSRLIGLARARYDWKAGRPNGG